MLFSYGIALNDTVDIEHLDFIEDFKAQQLEKLLDKHYPRANDRVSRRKFIEIWFRSEPLVWVGGLTDFTTNFGVFIRFSDGSVCASGKNVGLGQKI